MSTGATNEYTCLGDWESAALTLTKEGNSHRFNLGEWLNSGERFIAEDESRYKRAHDLTDLSVPHLRNVACVTRSIPASLRNYAVKWNHYVAVAPLPPDEQALWLERAEQQKLTVAEFRRLIGAGDSAPVETPAPQPDSGPLALLSDCDWSRLCTNAALLGKAPAELAKEILVQWLDEKEVTHASNISHVPSQEAIATIN